MAHIIIPDQSGLLDLLEGLGAQGLERLYAVVTRAVTSSFKTHPTRPTAAAITERTEICYKWFKILAGEHGWSCQRAFDHLVLALECDLNGDEFVPPEGNIWMPRYDDGDDGGVDFTGDLNLN